VVANPEGSTNASATLTMVIPPSFTQNPLAMTVAPTERITLSVCISGHPPPFTYEWRLLNTPLHTNVSSATMDFFTFTAPAYPTQQNYRVIVKNPANPLGVASSFATITVAVDTDADGLPDIWELAYGFPADSAANRLLDADGDGVSNYDEYLSGSNPTNAASFLKVAALTVTTNALLVFTAQSNKTYTVLWREAVGANNWLRLVDVPAVSTQWLPTITVPHALTTNRFFQIVTPRLP
jgi:hypothetical protein